MSTTDRLFDVTDYGGEVTPADKRRRSRQATASSPVEPHQEPWTAMRNTKGVLPFFHVVASRNSQSASLSMCGQWGTTITNLGVDEMIRCPLCQLELERYTP
jgi:hypothetical protein